MLGVVARFFARFANFFYVLKVIEAHKFVFDYVIEIKKGQYLKIELNEQNEVFEI